MDWLIGSRERDTSLESTKVSLGRTSYVKPRDSLNVNAQLWLHKLHKFRKTWLGPHAQYEKGIEAKEQSPSLCVDDLGVWKSIPYSPRAFDTVANYCVFFITTRI